MNAVPADAPAYILHDEWLKRRAKNTAFSQRAFARFLGISPASLSDILLGKRDLSPKMALQIAQRCELDIHQRKKFLASVLPHDLWDQGGEQAEIFLTPEEFASICDWEYSAILNIAAFDQNSADTTWMAASLGVPVARVESALEQLIDLNLIEIQEGRLLRNDALIRIESDIPSQTIQRFQKQILEKTAASLEKDSISARDVTAMTMAVNPEKIPEAKRLIAEFQNKLLALMGEGNKSAVYALLVNLIPLTRSEEDFP